MKATNEKCCVCGKQAIIRSFDGTGWCKAHHRDWRDFLKAHRREYDGLADAFDAWLKQAKAKFAEAVA